MTEWPEGVDEALLEDTYSKGLLGVDIHLHHWNIVPSLLGREVIEESERIENLDLVADATAILGTVEAQSC